MNKSLITSDFFGSARLPSLYWSPLAVGKNDLKGTSYSDIGITKELPSVESVLELMLQDDIPAYQSMTQPNTATIDVFPICVEQIPIEPDNKVFFKVQGKPVEQQTQRATTEEDTKEAASPQKLDRPLYEYGSASTDADSIPTSIEGESGFVELFLDILPVEIRNDLSLSVIDSQFNFSYTLEPSTVARFLSELSGGNLPESILSSLASMGTVQLAMNGADVAFEYSGHLAIDLTELTGLTSIPKALNDLIDYDKNVDNGTELQLSDLSISAQNNGQLLILSGMFNSTRINFAINRSDQSLEVSLPNGIEIELSEAVKTIGFDRSTIDLFESTIGSLLDNNIDAEGIQLSIQDPSLRLQQAGNSSSKSVSFSGGLNDSQIEFSLGESPSFSIGFDNFSFSRIEALSSVPLIGGLSVCDSRVILTTKSSTINDDILSSFNLVKGLNLIGTLAFDGTDAVSTFLNEIGLKSATVGLGIGSEELSLQGSVNADIALLKPAKEGDFGIDLRRVGVGINYKFGSSSPALILSSVLSLSGYDPFQVGEPNLNLTGMLSLDAKSITGGVALEASADFAWINPFGLEGAEFEGLSFQLGGTYIAPYIDNIGIAADLKLADGMAFDLALSIDTNDPDKLAFEITIEEELSLFDIPTQFGNLFTGSLDTLPDVKEAVQEAVEILGEGLTLIKDSIGEISIISVDGLDEDTEIDPLIKFALSDTKIVNRTITRGIEINAEAKFLGSTSTFTLEADPFSSDPKFTGSLSISEIKIGDFLTIAGSSSDEINNDVDLSFEFSRESQFIRGDGSLTVFGHQVADTNFSISSEKVEVREFDFDIGVIKLDINDFLVDWTDSPGASGDGSLTIFGHEVADVDFIIGSNGISIKDFDFNIGIVALNVDDFVFNPNTKQASGKGELTFLGQEIAGVDFEISDNQATLREFKVGFGDILGLDVEDIQIESNGKFSGSATVKFLGQDLAGARISSNGTNFEATGRIEIDTGVLGVIGANLTIASDGTLESATVASQFEIAGQSVTLFDLRLAAIQNPLDLVGELAEYVMDQAIQLATETIDTVTDTLLDLGSAAVDFVSNAFEDAVAAIGAVFNDIADWVTGRHYSQESKLGDWDDTFDAKGGDDTVYAGRGSDTILGGDGNDRLHGERGHDRLVGNNGHDKLYGGSGNDSLWGGNGNDRLAADDGDDKLYGGAGNDLLYGSRGNDQLHGNDGDDDVRGEVGDDTLSGGNGNDTLSGGTGRDKLYGGDGSDDLHGSEGDDYLSGGMGRDKLYGGDGNDTLSGEGWNDYLSGQDGHDILHGGDGHDALAGGSGNDSLHGGNHNDYLEGNSGDDILSGDSGNDRLYGGLGNDILMGGVGDDRLHGQDGDDVMIGGSGSDYLDGGFGNDSLRGNEGNDDLHGGSGNDYLDGGNGDDILSGGIGANHLIGGTGADTFILSTTLTGISHDTVADFQADQRDKIKVNVSSGARDSFSYDQDSGLLSYQSDILASLGKGTAFSTQSDLTLL